MKTEPLLFDKLLEPINDLLEQLDAEPISQAAEKLKYRIFIRVLLFRLFGQIRSLRDLVLDLKTNLAVPLLGLPTLGLSTLHDGFSRYPVEWVIRSIKHLQANHSLNEIDELQALGQIWAVDSSHWPIVRRLSWLRSQNLTGIRLHLGLSLNRLCPDTIALTYDQAPSSSERASLLEMAQAGITYVADRGYLGIRLYRELMERGAFFIIRELSCPRFRVLCELPVDSHDCLQHLTAISDQIIKLTRDPNGTILRMISFTIGRHQFRLMTNRFDLPTWQITIIYAWRWQVELIFRAWKHTLGGLHLINLSEAGVCTQLYLLLLASLLWTRLEQMAEAQSPAADSKPKTPTDSKKADSITAQLSRVFQTPWRLLRKALRICANCLAQCFSFYLRERSRL